jgi:hypothetical protein
MIREIGEELRLALGADFGLAQRPLAELRFDAWSESAETRTSYELAVHEAAFSGASALAELAANPENRRAIESEIRAGRCIDGTRISPTMARALNSLSQDRA